MQKLIKILDPDKAQELAACGFNYTTETINQELVYSFFVSKELMEYVNSKFSRKDFFLSDKLYF